MRINGGSNNVSPVGATTLSTYVMWDKGRKLCLMNYAPHTKIVKLSVMYSKNLTTTGRSLKSRYFSTCITGFISKLISNSSILNSNRTDYNLYSGISNN